MNYYVIGHGHSGSTLLDIFLSSDDETISLGEFHAFFLWRKKPCLCGQPVEDCSLWGRVISSYGERQLLTLEDGRKKYDRLGAWMLYDWSGWRAYIENYASLIEMIKAQSGKKYVVESSKSNWVNALRPYNFYRANKCAATFAYIIKEPGSVVESCLKSDRRKERKISAFTPLKHAISWAISNLIALTYCLLSRKCTLVDYASFVERPEIYADKFSINLSGRKFVFNLEHYIAGNRMVEDASRRCAVEIRDLIPQAPKSKLGVILMPLYHLLGRLK